MNPYRVIDLATWPRRRMFEFYRGFDSPCFHVSVKVPGGALQAFAKARGESFFLLALYAILRAANQVPQLRQRICDGQVLEFERIAVMTPIMTPEEMFCQIWCEYQPDFETFRDAVAPLVAAAKTGAPAPMEEHSDDFLCASCVPWLHFTSITQADLSFDQSVPILAWGKLDHEQGIPISGKFNHCLVDGLHIGRFFERVEQSFAVPESLWTAVTI